MFVRSDPCGSAKPWHQILEIVDLSPYNRIHAGLDGFGDLFLPVGGARFTRLIFNCVSPGNYSKAIYFSQRYTFTKDE